MNSKERVLLAFNHQEPDRVPIDWVGANGNIDARIRKHFGLAANDDEGLRQALHVDFRVVNVPYIGPKLHPDVPGCEIDFWGKHRRWIEHESGGYWDYCDFPLKDAALEQILNWPMPSPDNFDYSRVEADCKKHSNYCVVYGNPGVVDIINSNGMLRTMEQILMDFALDDKAGLTLVARRLDVQREIMARVLEKARGRIDMIWIGEDLGCQYSPILSKEMFRKHIRPHHQKFIDLAKSYNLPVMIHSCGSSSWAFEDFIEMGINVVDTLQPEAANMQPEYLKKNYGGQLSFHGCISTAGPMAYGSVESTIKNVLETLEIMKPGGGYAMSPTHEIQDNSPTENVLAAYETAYQFGQY